MVNQTKIQASRRALTPTLRKLLRSPVIADRAVGRFYVVFLSPDAQGQNRKRHPLALAPTSFNHLVDVMVDSPYKDNWLLAARIASHDEALLRLSTHPDDLIATTAWKRARRLHAVNKSGLSKLVYHRDKTLRKNETFDSDTEQEQYRAVEKAIGRSIGFGLSFLDGTTPMQRLTQLEADLRAQIDQP